MMTVKISTNRPIPTFTTLCCVPAWAPCSCSPCPPVPLRWWRGQWPAGRGQCRGGRCQLSRLLGRTPAGQISTKQKTIVRCVTISTSHLVTCLLVRTCLFAFTCSRLTSTLPWEREMINKVYGNWMSATKCSSLSLFSLTLLATTPAVMVSDWHPQ